MANIMGESLLLLRLTGAVLCGYVADHAYLVLSNASTVAQLHTLPFVHDVLHVDATHRVAPELDAECTASEQSGEPLRVVLLTPAVPGLRLHELASAARRLLGRNGTVLRVSSASGTGFEPDARRGKLELLLHSAQCDSLLALSRQPWAQWLEPAPRVAARNLFAVAGVLSDAWSDCDASSLPPDGAALDPALLQRPLWAAGLTGRGQIIGLGDTGLDLQSCFFADVDPIGTALPPGPWHRKVLAYNAAYGDAVDGNGHGTHVGGTLAGSALGGSPWNGIARDARLVVSDLGVGATGQLHLPEDLSSYFGYAYRLGARIHSDSWGGSTPSYDALAQETDAFCWEHEAFLPVFAAGNFGVVANPATAKNALAVGAIMAASTAGPASASEATSADAESPLLLYDVVAPFSATGPTADGRMKPDVIAPGETRSAAPAPGGGPGCHTETSRGTSMAAPMAAGAATLVRQYFVDGWYPSGRPTPQDALQPSSALNKAVIINGADTLPGVDAALQGHGRLHLGSHALPLHSNDTGAWRPRMYVIDRLAVATGQAHRYCVRVTAAGSGVAIASADDPPRRATPEQLRVTLAWTDPPVLPSVGGPVLVNDLDLRVTPLQADALQSEQTSAVANRVDNVERVILDLQPQAASFLVEVAGHRVAWPQAAKGGQPYALVATGPGLSGAPWTDAASCAVMPPTAV